MKGLCLLYVYPEEIFTIWSGRSDGGRVGGRLSRELVGEIVGVELIANARLERRRYFLIEQIVPFDAVKEGVSFYFTGAVRAQTFAWRFDQQFQYEIFGIFAKKSRHRRLWFEYAFWYVGRYVFFTLHGKRRRTGEQFIRQYAQTPPIDRLKYHIYKYIIFLYIKYPFSGA